jgi:hypothetical protein
MQSFLQGVRNLARLFNADAPLARMRQIEAQKRSIQLLKRNLSSTQREQYDRRGHFEVIGGDTGRCYRIRHGVQMNVELLNGNGRRICLLCFMPEGRVPLGDVMLAQKLALELFETEAIQIANRMPPSEEFWDDIAMRGYRRDRF